MTTPVGGTTATTAPGAAPAARKGDDNTMGQDAFMKLLVAQLKYQNPMAPTGGQEYMTQMATFTQVEKLGQLVTAQKDAAQWQQRLSAEGLLGRTVTGTTGEPAEAITGTVTGVRFAADGPVLELSDGRTLLASTVTRAVQESPSSSPSPASGASTTDGGTGTTSSTS